MNSMQLTVISAAITGITLASTFAMAGTPETATFKNPRYKGYALDWCVNWGEVGCGTRVANSYCKLKGFKKATSFTKWEDPHIKTHLLGSSNICNIPQCDTFHVINCE